MNQNRKNRYQIRLSKKKKTVLVLWLFLIAVITLIGQQLLDAGHVVYPEVLVLAEIPVNNITTEYRFDECDWDGSADEVVDEKIEHPGTIVGTPTTFQGRLCKGGDFRGGLNDNYHIRSQNVLTDVTSFSVSMWINAENIATSEVLSASKFQGTSNTMKLWLNGDNIYTQLYDNQSTYSTFTSSNMILADTWHHIVWVRDGTSQTMYVDNTVISGTNVTLLDNDPTTMDTLRIGTGNTQDNPDFDGFIDEIKIFNIALTASEVGQIYTYESDPPLRNADGTARECANCNVYADWTFDNCYYDNVDDILMDESGSGSTGEIVAAPISANGQVCRSAMLNGSDYFKVENNYLDNIENEITITGWIYKFAKPGASSYIISKGGKETGPDNGFQLLATEDNRIIWRLNGENTAGNYIRSDAGIITNSTWTHVVVTFKNETDKMRLYIDGVVADSATYLSTIGANTFNLFIGWDSTNTANGFYGRLDEFRIYNEAFNDDQVETIYNYQVSGLNANGTSRPCFDCVPDPQLEYDFDDCGTYASGNDVEDVSPNSHNGVAIETPFNAEGKLCQGVVMVDSAYFEVTDDDALEGGNTITLMSWVLIEPNHEGSTRTLTLASKFGSSADSSGYQLAFIQNDNDNANIYWDTDSNRVISSVKIDTSVWVHVTASFDGYYKRLYINGVLDTIVAYSNNSINSTTYNLYIGAEKDASNYKNFFSGKVDDFLLFNEPLSENQIDKVYNYQIANKNYDGSPRICVDCPPLAEWRFDECSWSGNTGDVKDSGPNGLDGTPIQTSYLSIVSDSILCNAADFEVSSSWFGDNGGYIEIPYDDRFNMVYDQIAISMWVYVRDATKAWLLSLNEEFLDCDDPNGPFSKMAYEIAVHNGDWVFQTTDDEWDPSPDCPDAQSNPWLDTYPVIENEWHHMVFTSDANNKKIYMDGNIVASKNFGSRIYQVSNINMYIGTTGGAVGYGLFDGILDEVALWNFPLTDERVMELYTNSRDGKNYDGTQRECGYCGIVSDWHFDECGWDNRQNEIINHVTKTTSENYYGTGFNLVQLDTADNVNNAVLSRSLEFDSGDYIEVANYDTLNGRRDFTLSMWVKPYEANNNIIFSGYRDSDGDNLMIEIVDTETMRTYLLDDSRGVQSFSFPSGTLSLNTWHHIVWRKYNRNQWLIVDGIFETPGSNYRRTKYVDIDHILFGKSLGYSNVNDFVGAIDEVIFFNSALYDNQVIDMYNNYSAGNNFSGTYRFYDDCTAKSSWEMDECHWYSPPKMQVENQVTLELNGTANNDLSTAPAQICFGADFDGQDDWIYTETSDILSDKSAMSASFFVRFDSLGSYGNQTVLMMGDTSDSVTPSFLVDYIGNTLRFFIYTSDVDYYYAEFVWPPNPGEWYHIVWSFYKYRPEQIHVYLDGVQKLAPTKSNGTFTKIRSQSNRFIMGRYRPSVPRYLNGGLDEVNIYNYCLNQEQIDNLLTETRECTNDCGNIELMVYYKFDECSYIGQEGEVKDYANVINLHGTMGTESNAFPDSGKVCRAGIFDGDFDYFLTDSTDFLAGSDEMTITLWTYLDRNYQDANFVKQNHYENDGFENTNKVFWFYYESYDSTLRLNIWKTDSYRKYYRYKWTPDIETWYHLAAVYDASEPDLINLYINGQKVSGPNVIQNTLNNIPSLPIHKERLIMGRNRIIYSGTNNFIWGKMDDLRIYKSALTDGQIVDVYNDVLGDCPECGSAGFPEKTGEWKFDACSWDGTVNEVKDNSLNYLHGSAQGAIPQKVEAKICNAAELNGNEVIVIPDDDLFDFQRSMSMSMWVYMKPGAGNRTLVSKSTSTTGFRLYVNDSEHIIWQTNDNFRDTGYILPENTWTHVAVVFSLDPQRKRLYINGQPQSDFWVVNTNMIANTQDLLFGAYDNGSFTDYFDGYLDNVIIFSTVLAPDHIEDLYNDTESFCKACAGDTVESSTVLPKDVFRLIGVPAIPDTANALFVIGDDLDNTIPTTTEYTWDLMAYNPIDTTFFHYSEDTASFPKFTPGKGFIVSQHLYENSTLHLKGEAVLTPFGYSVDSQDGLNLIANPFESMLRWHNVRVAQGVDTISISEAASAGWVNSYAYIWDYKNSEYYPIDPEVDSWYDRDTLSSWEGYWFIVNSSTPTKLIYERENFGKSNFDAPLYISRYGDDVRDYLRNETVSITNEWIGILSVTSLDGAYRSSNNRFGVDETASEDYDGKDAIYFSPEASSFVSLYYFNGDNNYKYDYKNSGWSKMDWEFRVKNYNIQDEQFKLYIPNVSALPGNVKFSLKSSNGALLIDDMKITKEYSFDLIKNTSKDFILSAQAVKDTISEGGRLAFARIPFNNREVDIYIFPEEKVSEVNFMIDGVNYSSWEMDRLYNVYRSRIKTTLSGDKEVILYIEDEFENISLDTIDFRFSTLEKMTQGEISSPDGLVSFSYKNSKTEQVFGLGNQSVKTSRINGEGMNLTIYSLQPYGLSLPGDSKLVFKTPQQKENYNEFKNYLIYRETSGEWEELKTEFDIYTGEISADITVSGNYILMKASSKNVVVPSQTKLYPNYPNPFNATTTISYSLANAERVSLVIYDVLGREVSVIVDGMQDAGIYNYVWSSRSDRAVNVASGLYFIQFKTPTKRISQKMILLK